MTRKTWKYMADAGKLLIPDALRKGKDMKEYSSQDYFDLDDHYQRLCNRQNEFIIWEGPVEGRTDTHECIFATKSLACHIWSWQVK